jgi:hypothetical protein
VDDEKYHRKVQTSMTNFIACGDYELIDDLNYVWKDILLGDNITFFMHK